MFVYIGIVGIAFDILEPAYLVKLDVILHMS